ncbi:MAG: 3-hydroxybutyrate oligomer hydrolase family protein [Pseudomonadota bacterium]
MFGRAQNDGFDVVASRGPVRREGDDDLLTGGLGLRGWRSEAPPTGATLRQQMIHRDVRALMDVTDAGGFGRLYGPDDPDQLQVLGVEIQALLRLPRQKHPFEVWVLIPDSLDRSKPCVVVAPSSGSRGVTGAIGDIGIWALTNGCALVLTDKGGGVGAHILSEDVVYGLGGTPMARGTSESIFALDIGRTEKRFLEKHPHAVALKHAHSGENVEALWPHTVLAAARFGAAQVSEWLTRSDVRPTVIAAGVSNGGGAVLRAAEIDREGIIDGVVAIEPNVSPPQSQYTIGFGKENSAFQSRCLYDIASTMALLTPVAVLHDQFSDYPMAAFTKAMRPQLENWARAMGKAGELGNGSMSDLVEEAVAKVRACGFSSKSDPCLHAMAIIQIWESVTVTFANALGRFKCSDALNGVTVAFADPGGTARAPSDIERTNLASQCVGLAPSGGLQLIGPSGQADLSFETLHSFRKLWTDRTKESQRVRQGVDAVEATGRLDDRPVAIVHGQDDSLINVKHSSRPYVARAVGHHRAKQTRYYEVENAQHFETLLMLPDFGKYYVPLAPYTDAMLMRMRECIEDGRPLPPSQRVVTKPRRSGADGTLVDLDEGNLGPIHDNPDEEHIVSWR